MRCLCRDVGRELDRWAIRFARHLAAEALLARGEATRQFPDALYLSKHICLEFNALPQQIACPPDGQAMPGTCGAVNRLGDKL